MGEQFVAIVSTLTRQMLFVVKWDTPAIGDGLVVISGASNQLFKSRWLMLDVAGGCGVFVHLRLQTTVATMTMCFFNVTELVRNIPHFGIYFHFKITNLMNFYRISTKKTAILNKV